MPKKKTKQTTTPTSKRKDGPTEADLSRCERILRRLPPVVDKTVKAEIMDALVEVAADPRHVNYGAGQVLRHTCDELGVPMPCPRSSAAAWVVRELANLGIQWGAE